MITEVSNEGRLAVAGSNGVYDSFSRDESSGLHGKDSERDSVSVTGLANPESVRSQKFYSSQFKRQIKLNLVIEAANIVLALFALVVVLEILSGCKTSGTNGSSSLSDYSKALDICKAQGKDAGAYSVYESCAKDADTKFGRKGENDAK